MRYVGKTLYAGFYAVFIILSPLTLLAFIYLNPLETLLMLAGGFLYAIALYVVIYMVQSDTDTPPIIELWARGLYGERVTMQFDALRADYLDLTLDLSLQRDNHGLRRARHQYAIDCYRLAISSTLDAIDQAILFPLAQASRLTRKSFRQGAMLTHCIYHKSLVCLQQRSVCRAGA